MGDKSVKAVMVNIFGGIMRCDIIAMGILNAVKVLNIKVPLVVRLLGTIMKEAKDLLENSGARIIFASDLDEAAEKAVKVARIVDMAQEAQLNVPSNCLSKRRVARSSAARFEVVNKAGGK